MRESLFFLESRFSQFLIVLMGVFLSGICLLLPFSYRFGNFLPVFTTVGIYLLATLSIFNFKDSRGDLSYIQLPMRLFFIFVIYVLLQYMGARYGFFVKSIYAYGARQEFVRLLSSFLLIQLIATYLSGHRTFIWMIVGSCLIAAYLTSFYVLYELFFDAPHAQTLGEVTSWVNRWIGVHPNRNNIASFLELMAPVSLGVTYYRFKHSQARHARNGASLALGLLTREAWFPILLSASLVISIGAVATLSKFSVLSLALGFLVFLALVRRGKNIAGNSLFLILAGVVAFVLIAVVVGNAFSWRWSQAKWSDWLTLDMRIPFWQRALPLFHKFFWFGSGLGTFSCVMSGFHRVGMNYFSVHLLNDYLELAIEIGITGLLIYLGFWVSCLSSSVRRISKEKSFFRSYVPAGIIAGAVSSLVRQMVMTNVYDFMNSFFVFLMLGILTAIVNEDGAEEVITGHRKEKVRFQFLWRWAFILTFLVGLASLAKQQLAGAFLTNHPIEMSYKRAFAVDSENSDYPYQLSKIYWNRSNELQDGARRLQKMREAEARLDQAIHINPYQIKYRIDKSELALQMNEIEEGDKSFEFLSKEFPFDHELTLSRGLFWAKASMVSSSSDRNRLLDHAAFYLNQISAEGATFQSDYFTQLREKRLSSLSPLVREALLDRNSSN